MTIQLDGSNGITLPDSTILSTVNTYGMRNRLINGDMKIDQRNSGASQTITAGAALAYTVDRWYGYCTGANVTGQRVTGSSGFQYTYQFTGAASVTGIFFGQRIETINSYDLAGNNVTLSFYMSNSLLTTVNWTAYYAQTADTFGTVASPSKNQFASGSITVSSSLTRYSITIPVSVYATTGIEILFSVGAQTSGTWIITGVQLEAGTTVTQFERRFIGHELSLSQRYYWTSNVGTSQVVESVATVVGAPVTQPIAFIPPMRTNSPTVNGPTALATSGMTVGSPTVLANTVPGVMTLNATYSVALGTRAYFQFNSGNLTADAEMYT